MFCNNIIASGFISANSYIGGISGGEITEALKNISISATEGNLFTFNNENYDGNVFITPVTRYLIIRTNALSDNERPKKETYSLWYSLPNGEGKFPEPSENGWIPIDYSKKPESDFVLWIDDSLTFALESDIMYIGLGEDATEPHPTIMLKVEGKGKETIIEDGTTT